MSARFVEGFHPKIIVCNFAHLYSISYYYKQAVSTITIAVMNSTSLRGRDMGYLASLKLRVNRVGDHNEGS